MAKSPKLPTLSPEQQSVFDELRKNVNYEAASAAPADGRSKSDIIDGVVENCFNQGSSAILSRYEKFNAAAKKDIEKHLVAAASELF